MPVVLTESQILRHLLRAAYRKSTAEGTSLEQVLGSLFDNTFASIWTGSGILTVVSTSSAGHSVSMDAGSSGGGMGVLDSGAAAGKLLERLEECRDANPSATDAELYACIRASLPWPPPRAVRPNFMGVGYL